MNRIAILASGSGSNAENILNYFMDNQGVKIVLFATENPKAFVIERAKKLGVNYEVFSMGAFRNGDFINVLSSYKVDFIVLAGFLKLVPEYLINAYPNKIVNIHPALLPKYGGKGMYGNKVHEAVIANNEAESGITIHYVNNNYDEGGIIFQAKCSIDKNDTPETLAQKVHKLEYEHYPKVIESILL
jgi:phosphoribosylglycinamide formyltransferase-1